MRNGSPTLDLDVALRLELDRFPLEVRFRSDARALGVFGPSGSGKTSLLESLAGLRAAARGRILRGGSAWLDAGVALDPARRCVGYVPQEGLLFPHLTVAQNLAAGAGRARAAGVDAAQLLERAVELLELGDLLERMPDTLSGGERQRVALGRALGSGPALLLLDEPLASLDLPLRRRLLPFLRRVQADAGLPMVLVSHDPLEVQALCDELLVLDRGRLVAQGPPRSVLTDPEVYPLAGRAGYENVLPARVLEHTPAATRLALGPAAGAPTGVELVTPRSARAPGEALWVSVPSSDVMLALEPPRAISARNVLAARVEEVRAVGDLRLVTASLHPDVPPLSVEVTEMTTSDLHLEPGARVHLVIKAFSCRLVDSVAL